MLDLSVKPGMKKGILTNNDVGIGTDNRYYTRLTGTRFTDRLRLMVVGNAYNSSGKGGALITDGKDLTQTRQQVSTSTMMTN